MKEITKKITFGLSVKECQKAILQLESYKKDVSKKVQLFTQKLAELGLHTAKAILQKHDDKEALSNLRIITDSTGNVIALRIVVESENLLFIEFGAGIKYNQGTGHPLAGKFGYGPGTYPGKGHWSDPFGWWYLDEHDNWVHSFGTKADMPMYAAGFEMTKKLYIVAREVFGG